MAERSPAYSLWLNALVLVGFGWLAILLELAPLGARASATPSPDLLFCVAAFLVLRRPNSTPAILVILLGLARDVIGGGAVGLGAIALFGAIEFLRANRDRLRRRSFISELAVIVVLAFAINAIHVVVLTITFAPSPALDILVLGVALTLGAYILIAGFFRFALRLKAEPLESRNLIRSAR